MVNSQRISAIIAHVRREGRQFIWTFEQSRIFAEKRKCQLKQHAEFPY